MRDFDYLWGRLQEFLVEEREDVNARSIEQALKSPQKTPTNPSKAGTPALQCRQKLHPLLSLLSKADVLKRHSGSTVHFGGYVNALEGKSSLALLPWGSRKQSVGSRSTTESEFVSLSGCPGALFSEGLPLLELWQAIRPPMFLRILEDNSAVIAIISKGYSHKLRHLANSHRVNVGCFHL